MRKLFDWVGWNIFSVLAVLVLGGATAYVVESFSDARHKKPALRMDAEIAEIINQHKDTTRHVAGFRAAVDRLLEGKIQCEVRTGELDAELAKMTGEGDATAASIRQYRNLIVGGAPVTLGGNRLSVSQLAAQAELSVARLQSQRARAQGTKQARHAYNEQANQLGQRAKSAQTTTTAMEGRLKEIQAKITALVAIRDASHLAGGDQRNLGQCFQEAHAEMNDLYATVAGALREQENAWRDYPAVIPMPLAEDVIAPRQVNDSQATLAHIDEVLGKEQR